MLRDHFYGPLSPELLPRGTPGADLYYGGTRAPIEGYQRLDGVKTPFVGWQITGPGVVSLKTLDVGAPGYAKPDAVFQAITKYAEQLANADIKKTDVASLPGVPRNRIEIVDPTEHILHVQLNGPPDDSQAEQLQRAREAAASLGVDLVILGPPSVSTSITTTGVPSPTYISTTPPLTPGPELENGQTKAQASVLVAGAAFGAINNYAGGVQKADADAATKDAFAQAAKEQQANPHTGVSVWTYWFKPDVSSYSANQPGAAFGGVVVSPEREPSNRPPDNTIVSPYVNGTTSIERVWIAPPDPSPATPPAPQQTDDRISATSAMIDRVQRSADAYGAEDFLQRAWNDRIGPVDTSQLEQARADLWNAIQAAAEGRYSDAEEAVYIAREELRAAQVALDSYQGKGPKL